MKFHFIIIVLIMSSCLEGRKHELLLENDDRPIIHISQFGFFRGGILEVTVNKLRMKQNAVEGNSKMVGFTVDRTLTDGINPYPHTANPLSCALNLDHDTLNEEGVQRITFSFDLNAQIVNVGCSSSMGQVRLYSNISGIPFQNLLSKGAAPGSSVGSRMVIQQNRKKRDAISNENKIESVPTQSQPSFSTSSTSTLKPDTVEVKQSVHNNVVADTNTAGNRNEIRLKDDAFLEANKQKGQQQLSLTSCKGHTFPLTITKEPNSDYVFFSTQFVVYVATEESEGSYNLYFHHCKTQDSSNNDIPVTVDLKIIEQNRDRNYLSAGEIPLPALYTMMSFLFFLSGSFWVFILRKSKKETGVSVYKIHYLMGALVYAKSLSLFFHAVNYHSIEVYGKHVETWAILYYITHLLKGALLFITILLIGTGYAFVKHLLSDKDKKIFMVVIPLQILANVAEIITEESEEGQMVHTTWKIIFVSVDLLCCGAILFPVVWSIRHLQEASQTDGKAATNLRKLKLFRHFYMIVVCYIYFTRIIVNMLLKITVPFQYKWLDAMVYEMATFIFFVLCGYKFRPAKNNPYLQLAHDSDDEDNDVALTQSGLVEGIIIKRGPNAKKKKTLKEMIIFDPNEEDTDDDEEVLLEKRRELNRDFH